MRIFYGISRNTWPQSTVIDVAAPVPLDLTELAGGYTDGASGMSGVYSGVVARRLSN